MFELQQLRVGTGSGPRVLITGGVHGDEFEPMAAIRRLHAALISRQIHGTVTLAPVVNEAAFRRGSRVAEDGLDLARTCPGKSDGSITEQTAFALSQLIDGTDFYIDLHTGGTRLQVLPLTGYTLHPDPEVLDWQRKMATAFGLPIVWGTDHRLNGRSLSVARDANVPAIYAEYLGGGGCDPSGIAAYVQGCLNVLSLVGVLAEPSVSRDAQRSAPLIVEDDRPNAGHMQINHPAPMDGFFEPAVRLGQLVEQGEPLGIVYDVTGGDARSILSAHSGIVLVLHTFPRVDAGECLGVILETQRKS